MNDQVRGAIDELFDDWLADPMFEAFRETLAAEIYKIQADTLESAPNWDTVCFNRGWCSALAYIRNMREMRENEKRAADGDFDASTENI